MAAVKIRFAFLDNIRSLVIFLVIAMHSAVTYSGFGFWYYVEGSPEKLLIWEFVFFGFLQSFIQAWTMGILFFISAFLAAKSLARHGAKKFIKERLFRLGVPLLIYQFLISPLMSFLTPGSNPMENHPEISLLKQYAFYVISLEWLGSTGPLWFVQVLLFFCIVYAMVKKLSPGGVKLQNITKANVIIIVLLTGAIAFLIRLIFPVGTSFMNLQFSYFSSYIVMFILGIIAGENNLMENIANFKNIFWLKLSLIIGIPMWAFVMIFGGVLSGEMKINGGFYWQSFAYSFWESFTAIAFSLGLISFFRDKVNIENKFTALMRENAFGIYVFHAPILTAVSLGLRHWMLNPVPKFFIVMLLAFVICLLFSALIRKIKPVGILLK